MKDIQVKKVMIPISNYVTVRKEDSLNEVLQALGETGSENARPHRDAIVVNDDGQVIGKVTMIDIFRALEPNYKKIDAKPTHGSLTSEFVKKVVEDFDLWKKPMEDVCKMGEKLKVSDVMHAPEESEYIEETDTLEKALNQYVMGVHQPIVVKKGENVTGMLRFGDLFEIVREHILSCLVA